MTYIPVISDIYNLLIGLINFLTGLSFQDMINMILAIPGLAGEIIGNIGTIVTYPITMTFNTLLGLFGDLFGHILAPIAAMINLSAAMLNIPVALLTNFWPLAWITLISTGFAIILIMRAYHFLKDVSIAGFKL